MKLDEKLNEMGAVRSKVDPCLFEWHNPAHGSVLILVYFDDLIVADEKLDGVTAVKRSVSAKFDVRDMGAVSVLIGMKVMHDREAKKLTLSNPGHIVTLLQAFGMEMCAPKKTAMASGVRLSKTDENLLIDGNRYAELVAPALPVYYEEAGHCH